jgi:hypothetical protein
MSKLNNEWANFQLESEPLLASVTNHTNGTHPFCSSPPRKRGAPGASD